MYAVIDLETTGLRTGWRHRVVEVAIVQLDEGGRVTHEWCTLVNPDRDLGPQGVHGISAAEARRAPTFDRVAGRIVELLRGRVVVAHNLTFDARFLIEEFDRLDVSLPLDERNGLCTLQLASHFLPSIGRGLAECRRAIGLPPHQAHSALHDARAAADLLNYYLLAAGDPPPWVETLRSARQLPWPVLVADDVPEVRRGAPLERPDHFLRRLVDRMPRRGEPDADRYLDLLDQVLLDLHISESEADALLAVAEELGLWREDVHRLHEQYLSELAVLALADGVVTRAERDDLEHVASLLGLGAGAVDRALDAAAGAAATQRRHRPRWQLQPDDEVVFTGSMRPDREEWEEQARQFGLRVGERVTKRTRLLIAADPDTMSSKAKTARRYGIPIVHPSGYLRLVDQMRRAPDTPALMGR